MRLAACNTNSAPRPRQAELLARIGRRVTQKFKFLSKIADAT